MVRSSRKVVALAAVALCATTGNWRKAIGFVPSPFRKPVAAATAASAATMFTPAAFADEIGDAAKKLGDASYAFASEVDGTTASSCSHQGSCSLLQH